MPYWVRVLLVLFAVVVLVLVGFGVIPADAHDPTQFEWAAFGLAAGFAALFPVPTPTDWRARS